MKNTKDKQVNNKKNLKEIIKNNKKTKAVAIIVAIVAVLTIGIILLSKYTSIGEKNFEDALKANDYYIEMTAIDENYNPTDKIIRISKHGNNIAIGNDKYTEISLDDGYYRVYKEEKAILKTQKDNEDNGIVTIDSTLFNKEPDSIQKVKLKGQEYTCKKYNTLKLYFIGDDIKYIEIDETVTLVSDFVGKANMNMFEIPEDYIIAEP